MAHDPGRRARPANRPAAPAEGGGGPKFARDTGFHAELRRRVDAYFRATGRRPRDCPRMYAKTAALLACLAGSYALLVLAAGAWWQALPLALLLGLSTAAVGFNVQHDGGHGAYSDRPWVNRLAAMALDLIGGSSYVWRWKHGVFHHTYANVTGHDADIDLGALGRLSPHQRRRAFHRWQHYYLWPLYGLLAVKWQLLDDFTAVAAGRVGGRRFPRPRGRELAAFLGGKAAFLGLAFGVPLLYHPAWVVAAFYGATALVVGVVLSVVFQLAHCVEPAAFPPPPGGGGRIASAWAVHQAEATVDFARGSRVASWLLGGLNFQIEHHLLPRVCHVHYPALSRLVEATCREFGVRYAEHRSIRAGVAAHFRWLRRMGMPDARAPAASGPG